MRVVYGKPPCDRCRYRLADGGCRAFRKKARPATCSKANLTPFPFALKPYLTNGRKIIRVFPRLTNCTPQDDHAYVGPPPSPMEKNPRVLEADEIHISVSWTWDLPEADNLAKLWKPYGTVLLGGPALGIREGAFVPGMYVRHGYTITSRGCPNKCWFCNVWKRNGGISTLDIFEGYNVLDDNLLACPDDHVKKVFKMLRTQPRDVEFTGGLEAARLKPWHVDELLNLRMYQMFFAYDTPDDLEPLRVALKMLTSAGFTRSYIRVYVLCGYPKDTPASAEKRMMEVVNLGGFPMAMLYNRNPDEEWRKFQRLWARPALIRGKLRRS